MKSLTEYLTFTVPERMAFVNITPQLEELVRRSGITEGLLLCNAMHITASVFVNDDERGLHEDYKKWLEKFPTVAALAKGVRLLSAKVKVQLSMDRTSRT